MTRPICDACGKPIRADQAAITNNTVTTRERWHLPCCPWVPRGPPAGRHTGKDANGVLASERASAIFSARDIP